MLICTTPVLGFAPGLESPNYPYWVGNGFASPQEGSVVDVLDTETLTSARYVFTEDGGDYSWEAEGE